MDALQPWLLNQLGRELTKPVNILATMLEGATLDQLAEAGAKRISIGGALARAALAPVVEAAAEMLERGSFGWTSELASSAQVEELFQKLDP